MRSTEVAVVHIGNWQPGRFEPFTPVQVITMKDLKTGKKLNLSLNKKNEKRVNDWLPAIQLGNTLLVTINTNQNVKKGQNPEYVDFAGKFELKSIPTKAKDNGAPIEKQEDAFKLSLALQLEKIEANANESLVLVNQIKSDFGL